MSLGEHAPRPPKGEQLAMFSTSANDITNDKLSTALHHAGNVPSNVQLSVQSQSSDLPLSANVAISVFVT